MLPTRRGRTRNLLVSSRTRIQLSHRGRYFAECTNTDSENPYVCHYIYEEHKHVQTLPKRKQEVTKVVSLVKMAENLPTAYSSFKEHLRLFYALGHVAYLP